jgi:hypothetical protein
MKAKTKLSVCARSAFALLLGTLCIKPATAYANIFVTGLNGTIGEYTNSGAVVNASLITGLSTPVGIAVSGNFLYVTSRDGGTIGKYTVTGQTVNPALVTGLSNPVGIAVSGDNIFVANVDSFSIT